MKPPSSSSNNTSGWSRPRRCDASVEIDQIVEQYSRKHGHMVRPDLNEVLYVAVRLAVSIQQDPSFHGSWSDLVRETRRRMFDHLGQGIGYRDRDEQVR